MSDDFGFYGNGLSGYVHYKQAVDRTVKGGGGGKRPHTNGSGCLTLIIAAVVVAYILFSGTII